MKAGVIIMRMKKALLVVCAMSIVLSMCACGVKDENTSNQNSVSTEEGGTVDFSLQGAPDPNFNSPNTSNGDKLYTIIGDYAYELDPSTLQPVGPPLDPVTHEPVDNPVFGGENPSTPNNPQYNQGEPETNQGQNGQENQGNETDPWGQWNGQGEQGEQEQQQQGQEQGGQQQQGQEEKQEDKPDTSLPNTGMFLEDD